MSAQAFAHDGTYCGITRAAGQRARYFECYKCRTVEAQAHLRDGAQKCHAPRMKAISRIEGGDPDVRVERQHRSARVQPVAIGGQDVRRGWPIGRM